MLCTLKQKCIYEAQLTQLTHIKSATLTTENLHNTMVMLDAMVHSDEGMAGWIYSMKGVN